MALSQEGAQPASTTNRTLGPAIAAVVRTVMPPLRHTGHGDVIRGNAGCSEPRDLAGNRQSIGLDIGVGRLVVSSSSLFPWMRRAHEPIPGVPHADGVRLRRAPHAAPLRAGPPTGCVWANRSDDMRGTVFPSVFRPTVRIERRGTNSPRSRRAGTGARERCRARPGTPLARRDARMAADEDPAGEARGRAGGQMGVAARGDGWLRHSSARDDSRLRRTARHRVRDSPGRVEEDSYPGPVDLVLYARTDDP